MLISVLLCLMSFPGPSNRFVDPSGRFEVMWFEPVSRTAHTLWFRRLRTNRRILVRTFTRSVDVLWSPTGDWFAVTDRESRDWSRTYVYSSRDPAAGHELRAELPAEVRQAAVSAVRWDGNTSVVLRTNRSEVRCRKAAAGWACRNQ